MQIYLSSTLALPWALFLFLLPVGTHGKYNMTATGGGVVPPGKTFTLSATTGVSFDRCYWYFPGKSAEHCIFGDGKLIRCTNEELKAKVNYTGTDPKICHISYGGGKAGEEESYECTIDGETPKGQINVLVASKIDKMELRVGNESEGYLEAGKMGPIFCVLFGGNPLGESNITTSGGLNVTSDETSVIKDSKGEKTSSHKIVVVPTVNDHGATINCTGHQYDKSDPRKELFEPSKDISTQLVVVFPPQPMKERVFMGALGDELKVMISVHSNPSPTSFLWVAKKKENDTVTSIELNNGDKVRIPMICSHVEENLKNCSMTFISLAKEDVMNVSYELQVENKFGKTLLPFSIRTPNSTTIPPTSSPAPSTVEPSNSTTPMPGNSTSAPGNSTTVSPISTTTESPEVGGGMSSYVIPLVIFIVIIIVLIVGMVAYKRYSAKRQTVPMSMQ